jgi:6-phosphofructokinase 2
LLANEGIAALDVPIAGETREDFSVTEMRSGKQFRFVLPGPVVSEAEVSASLDAALALVKPDDFLVASGSLPPGAPHDTYQKVAHRSGAAGARFVLDCPADLLRGSLGPGLELIKPSFSEFVGLTGVSPREVEAARQAIDHLIATDRIRSIALTLGDEGAWYIGRNFAYSAKAPHVEPRSTVGAGDSFLAGLVLSLAESRSPEQSVRFAVACGAAALLAPGVELCRPDDVEKLLAAVVVELLP